MMSMVEANGLISGWEKPPGFFQYILSCLDLKSVYLTIKPVLKQILSHFKIMPRLEI